ncbi:MAG: serine/threonine protein kinase [Candidatus Peregrinibacteria bacterium Gr01-1014_25]|nr:MAG: serine/threonine protein kinase [Candidatus Peregrinibacteria bacterium Gr01-1014_25]
MSNAPAIAPLRDTSAWNDAPVVIKLPTGKTMRLESLLGRGGCGEAWLASIDECDTRVVVKRAREDEHVDANALRERLRNESRILSGIDIPGVPRLLLSGDDRGAPYLVMEHVDGIPGSALTREAHAGEIPLARLMPMFAQLSRTVADLHDLGIVHSDIKPENTRIGCVDGRCADRRPWLLDFGLARPVATESTRLTAEGQTMGTQGFLDPRMIGRACERDAPADVYALGATCFEWYAGEPLFPSHDAWWQVARMRLDIDRGESTDDALAAHIDRLVEERIASVRRKERCVEVESLLARLLAYELPRRARPSAHCTAAAWEMLCTRYARKRISRRGMLLALAGIGASTAAGIAALLHTEQTEPGGAVAVMEQRAPRNERASLLCTQDAIECHHGDSPLLRVNRNAACILAARCEGQEGIAWLFTMTRKELTTLLERMAPGSGSGLPSPQYPCTCFVLPQRAEALLSLPRGCLHAKGGTTTFHARDALGVPGAQQVQAFLRRWPQGSRSIDRVLSMPAGDDTPPEKTLARANAALRTLQTAAAISKR